MESIQQISFSAVSDNILHKAGVRQPLGSVWSDWYPECGADRGDQILYTDIKDAPDGVRHCKVCYPE